MMMMIYSRMQPISLHILNQKSSSSKLCHRVKGCHADASKMYCLLETRNEVITQQCTLRISLDVTFHLTRLRSLSSILCYVLYKITRSIYNREAYRLSETVMLDPSDDNENYSTASRNLSHNRLTWSPYLSCFLLSGLLQIYSWHFILYTSFR